MMGQAAHFNRYAYKPEPYGVWRYTAESRRLNHVLDTQLVSLLGSLVLSLQNMARANSSTSNPLQSASPYVAGDRLTVADVAVFIYTHSAQWCGIDLKEYPHVKAWHDKLVQRPAFQKGLQVPVPYQFSDEAVMAPENQDFFHMIRKFGAQMMKGGTEKWKGEVLATPSDHANYESN